MLKTNRIEVSGDLRIWYSAVQYGTVRYSDSKKIRILRPCPLAPSVRAGQPTQATATTSRTTWNDALAPAAP